MRIARFVAIAAFGLAPAFAQTPAPRPASSLPPESITVIGTKPSVATIENFVEARGLRTHSLDRIARWSLKVCPVTIGLGDKYAAYVTKRIRDVAAAVGAPVDPDPACQPNIEIVFTTKPQSLIDSIRKTDPVYLGFHYTEREADDLAKVTHPIQAWYTNISTFMYEHRPPGYGGQTLDMGRCGVTNSVSVKLGGHRLTLHCLTEAGGSPSRARDGMNGGFLNILIVAEPARLFDYEVGSLADYITMLALSQPATLGGCEDLQSISNLLTPDCAGAASQITNADIAYLRALYETAGGDRLPTQRTYIREEMYRMLVTDKGG